MPDTPSPVPAAPSENPPKVNGGRNLIILCFGAILIAIITTGFSLWAYRQNDIYLDRSRPGFIAEGEKNEEEVLDKFSGEGEIDAAVLDQYLSEFDYVKGKIDGLSNSFSDGPLADKNFLFDDDDNSSADSASENTP